MFNVDNWRTYVTFKQECGTEDYVKIVTNRQNTAALSHFRVLSGNREMSKYQNRL